MRKNIHSSYLKRIIIILLLLLFAQSSVYAASVTIRWTANTEPDLDHYNIYYKINSPGDPGDLSTYNGTGLTRGASGFAVALNEDENDAADKFDFTVTGLTDDVIYYFVITAVDTESLESDGSDEISTGGNPAPVINTLNVNGTGGADAVYTNAATRQVSVRIAAADDNTVNQYLILDNDSDYNHGTFQDVSGGPEQNKDFTIAFTLNDSDGSRTIYAWVKDSLGTISSAASRLNIILDRVAPTATFLYSTTAPTNQNVTATLQPSESVTITNNGGNTTYAFTENGNFTFEFVDLSGNTGSATATVNNIDKISPTGSISYSVDDTGHVNTSSMIITASFNEPLNAAPQILITGGGPPLDINPAQSMSWSGNTWTTVLNVPTGDNTDYSVTVSNIFDQAGNNGANLAGSFTTDTIDTDGDGMPDSFENEHSFLDPLNPLDADEDEDGDGSTNKQEYDDGTDLATNMGPDKPGKIGPADGDPLASLTPELLTQAYNDNENDVHWKTCWQISTASDFADVVDMVLEVESDKWLTSFDVYALLLEPATTYYWRAKFYDDQNGASLWSEPFSFTTALTDPDDYDGDGTYDDQEVSDSSVDLNNNELPDINEEQGKYKVVNTVVGSGQIGIEASTNVLSIISLRSFDPGELQDFEQPEDMPLGCIDFKIEVENSDMEAQVIVYLSEPASDNAVWYKYDPANGWEDWTDLGYAEFIDSTSVLITLTDGGAGDADGVVNGVIVDPSGFGGTASMATVSDENSSGGGGGGGGCFIDTVLSCLPDFRCFFRWSLF